MVDQSFDPSDSSTISASNVMPIAVRALAQAVHRHGGLGGPVYASVSGLEGTRLHQKLVSQFVKKYGASAVLSEISLKNQFQLESLNLQVSGRCDLIVLKPDETVLYEIKSYSGSADKLPNDGELVHWAQAKLYGFLYATQQRLHHLSVGLIYISQDHDDLVSLQKNYSTTELEKFFLDTLNQFSKVARRIFESIRLRDQSAKSCQFPFSSLRPGQKRMMNEVIGTARQKGVLFAQAPTGTGKTLSVLFPAIRLLAHHQMDKVFYLTAMTSTRKIAEQALDDLRKNGLILRSITLKAKEKSCLIPDIFCQTKKCPYSINYYQHLPTALEDLFAQNGHCTPEFISEVAQRHRVCPFELSLDYSIYCDVIIGDYNYVFDPRIQLARFFSVLDQHHLLLVDEAHNLVDRSREMYSAELDFSKFNSVFELLPETSASLKKQIESIILYGQTLSEALLHPKINEETPGFSKVEGNQNNRQMIGDQFAAQTQKPEQLLRQLGRLNYLLRQFLDDQEDHPDQPKFLDLFLQVHFFLKVADLFYRSSYITTAKIDHFALIVKLNCLDASESLTQIYLNRHATVFFSATLAPLHYYTELLLDSKSGYTPEILTLPSPFAADHLKILIEPRLSTRYQERSNTIQAIVDQILLAASVRTGNYLVFLPSYSYLKQVRQLLRVHALRQQFDFVVQIPNMDDAQKQQFLQKFENFGQKTLIGLAIIGSLFNEGIDLSGERLSGVMVVGVGLPQISPEREIMSQYFAGKFGRGFEFAYQYPGFNKIQQAAGRVIRSETDVGFVMLMDDRYQKEDYQALFPQEWQPVYLNEKLQLRQELSEFWANYKS